MGDDSVLNMSLDDIIKQKSSKPRANGQSRQKRSSDGGYRGKGESNGRLGVAVADNSIRKKQNRARPSGERFQQVQKSSLYSDPPRNPDALHGSAAWEHDLFEGGDQPRKIKPAASGFKLLISNLDFKVTDEDIAELFDGFGVIKRSGILYDRSGRSEEAAEVIFERRQDALEALKKYNNLALDNKPMKIELVEGSGVAAGQTLSSGLRLGGRMEAAPRGTQRMSQNRGPQQAKPRYARTEQKRNYNNRTNDRQPRGRGATISQADLDKDLDTYMAE